MYNYFYNLIQRKEVEFLEVQRLYFVIMQIDDQDCVVDNGNEYGGWTYKTI